MSTYSVIHTVVQSVEAPTPEDAELIARRAIEHAPSLWWPTVAEDADVTIEEG